MKNQNSYKHKPEAGNPQLAATFSHPGMYMKAIPGGRAKNADSNYAKMNGGYELPSFTLYPLYGNQVNVPDFFVTSTKATPANRTTARPGITPGLLQQGFFNQTTSMTWFVDEDDCLIYANPALLGFLNMDKRDLNKKVTEILPKFILGKFMKAHLSVRASGLPFKKILMQPMANGTNNYYLINIYPFTNRYNKNLLVGEAFDITYSYRAQEEMAKANERLIHMSKVTTEAIWDWDIETGYVFRNERLMNLVGLTENKPFDADWWYSLIHPEDRARVKHKLENALKNEQITWEHEFSIKNINNEYITLHEQGFIIYKNGVAVNMIGSLRDVTELKILESKLIQEKIMQQKKLAEAMVMGQEKERTRLGHELHDNVNQLLATSKLFLGLVKADDKESNELKKKVSEYIDTACNEIRNLSHGLVMPNFDKTGLAGSFNKIVNDLRLSNMFQIAFEYDKKIEVLNDSKKVTLLRILQEQIKNIIKYSHATKVTIELSVVKNKAHLCISDNGVGFDADLSRRGIGLSNIYDRTKLYDGSVNLDTAPGKGCKLTATIPVKNK